MIILCLSSILPTCATATATTVETPSSTDGILGPQQQIVTTQIVTINIPGAEQGAIREVKVAPGDLTTVFFKGWVELATWGPLKNIDQVIVNLHADIEDPGWSVMVNPPVVSFPYLGTRNPPPQEISINVLAPLRAARQEKTIEVVIGGTWMTTPTSASGDVLEQTVNVEVVQFPDLLLDSFDIMLERSPGSDIRFELQIHNRGNSIDDFMVEIVNIDTLNNAGWAIEISQSTIEDIAPWTFKNVTIHVYSPQKFTPWKNQVTEIIVSVTSVSSVGSNYERLGNKELSFFFYERGVYIPPEPAACFIIFLIILIVGVTWYRRRSYRKLVAAAEEAEEPDADEADEEPDD